MAQIDKLMREFTARYETALKENEQRLQSAQQQYEAAMSEAQNTFEALVASSKSEQEELKEEASGAASAPAAAWINAPDGEKMMVLNREAVVMFLAVFERIGEIAETFNKGSKE